MFENLSHEALQQYWWVIVSILGAVLVFLMFVQGGQTLFRQLAKTEDEKSLLINSIGRKWEFTFTTLVTFGGAFFASFPLFYSTSFGGAYWVWMTILFTFIVQAVSFEFRNKAGNFLGAKVYEGFLFANGLLAPLLIGAAVATFFSGSSFSVDQFNLSKWEHPAMGLEAALSVFNLSLGIAVLFLARILAGLYFLNDVSNDAIAERARKQIKFDSVPFLVSFLAFVGMLLTKSGFAVDSATKTVSMEDFKYLNNLLEMPVVLILFLAGVVLVLFGIYQAVLKQTNSGIWSSGIGTVLTVLALLFLAAFNNTAYYPSTFDLQSSLTIYNSSSSHYTLTAMSYVSLFVPVVIAYIWYVWKSMNKKKIDMQDLKDSGHAY